MFDLRKIDVATEAVPTPTAGRVFVFMRSDGVMCSKDDAGIVRVAEGAPGAGFRAAKNVGFIGASSTANEQLVSSWFCPVGVLAVGGVLRVTAQFRHVAGQANGGYTSTTRLRVAVGDAQAFNPVLPLIAASVSTITHVAATPAHTRRIIGEFALTQSGGNFELLGSINEFGAQSLVTAQSSPAGNALVSNALGLTFQLTHQKSSSGYLMDYDRVRWELLN